MKKRAPRITVTSENLRSWMADDERVVHEVAKLLYYNNILLGDLVGLRELVDRSDPYAQLYKRWEKQVRHVRKDLSMTLQEEWFDRVLEAQEELVLQHWDGCDAEEEDRGIVEDYLWYILHSLQDMRRVGFNVQSGIDLIEQVMKGRN